MSLRNGGIRLTIPSAIVAAVISAATTGAVAHWTSPPSPSADAVADLRGDVKALQATVRALADDQRALLDRINRDADAANNRAVVEALKARGAAP